MQDDDAAQPAPGVNGMSVESSALESASQSLAFGTNQEQGEQRGPSILVVEDDHALAHLEAEILSTHGYSVVVVNTGENALRVLNQITPDLVVLDLELTGDIQGWDVFQVLRAIARTPVLLTTSSVTTIRKAMRSSGESRATLDHLPKPYLMQTLLKRVKRMLPAPQ